MHTGLKSVWGVHQFGWGWGGVLQLQPPPPSPPQALACLRPWNNHCSTPQITVQTTCMALMAETKCGSPAILVSYLQSFAGIPAASSVDNQNFCDFIHLTLFTFNCYVCYSRIIAAK